jgi:hypothetical protein
VKIFSSIEAWFKKVFTNAPSWDKIASATLTVVAPLVETVVALTAGEPASAAIAVIVGKIQSDLGAATALIESATASPTLTTILNAVKANLSALLVAGQISDPKTVAEVTSIVNTVIAEIEAISSVVPATA